MTLGRREFLQRLGLALAALGMADATLAGLGNTYQQALARSSRRLALLVGINQYPAAIWQQKAPSEKGAFLQGALMDVELQRELLIHRFGVLPTDIVTLVNKQATGRGIVEAIQGHLADQAQPGDTIIFHFSGLGSQVHLTGRSASEHLPTLVPADGTLPRDEGDTIHDLFEETLAQILGSLQGVRVVTILDASGAAPRTSPLQGNFRVRSRLTIPTGTWQAAPGISLPVPQTPADDLSRSWPGLLLRASKPGMPALEGNWHGFSAGVFTYALTQQIWNSFPSQRQSWIFQRAAYKMETWSGAVVSPELRGELASKDKSDLLNTGGIPKPAADGFVKTIDAANRNAFLWLGGLSASLLPYCALGLRLQPLPALPGLAAVPQGTLIVKGLRGLTAKAELLGAESLSEGTPLVEIERRLPRDIDLCVALDPTLERIERVDATSALAGLSEITTTAPGEQQADCLFGPLAAVDQPSGESPAIDINQTDADQPENYAASQSGTAGIPLGYGLFSPNHTLLPGTAPEEGEAVKTAVGRLTPLLHELLAVKMLHLTTNSMSSQLPVRFSLETMESPGQLVLIEETLRSRQFAKTKTVQLSQPISDANQPKFQIQLLNLGQQPLYYLLISVLEKSRLFVYCPFVEPASSTEKIAEVVAHTSQLKPGSRLKVPMQTDNGLPWQRLQATELFAIACTQPFYETWKAIRTPEFRQSSDQLASIPDPLAMAKAVFEDLHRASQGKNTVSSPQELLVTLRSDAWATLLMRSPIIQRKVV
ncbi:MAG: caspase family protein [Cyanobacteria bacterium P01_F01_bin.86]